VGLEDGKLQNTAVSGRGKYRSVLRTVRLPENVDQVLVSEAESRDLSPNALSSSIMTKFAEWDRFASRFHFISLTSDLVKGFLDLVDDKKLENLAEDRGSQEPEEAMLFWFKEVSIDNLIRFLSDRCRHAGYGEFEYQETQGHCTLTIHHELGPKWSLFFKKYLETALDKTFHLTAESQTTDSSVSMKFHI
jgi:hypothetical protein